MNVCFTPEGWEDYQHWVSEDGKMEKRIARLIKEIAREPFKGVGKAEPLKGEFSGWWSRRIDEKHRLIYRIADDTLWIGQARYHYHK